MEKHNRLLFMRFMEQKSYRAVPETPVLIIFLQDFCVVGIFFREKSAIAHPVFKILGRASPDCNGADDADSRRGAGKEL